MKAAIRPQRIIPFDDIDDFISIDNSGVGSPYDLDINNAFTMAVVFRPGKTAYTTMEFFDKRTATAGYALGMVNNSIPFFTFRATVSGAIAVTCNSSFGILTTTDNIIICTYDGSGDINNGTVMHIYPSGILSTRAKVSDGTMGNPGSATLSGSGKTTVPLWIGRNQVFPRYYKGNLAHPSVWNVSLSNAQADDLAAKIKSDTVSGHALYSSNCIGYWREYLPKIKLINAVNQTYNATPVNF